MRNGYVYIIAVKPFLTATFLEIAVSCDFCVFWILEAARGKFKEIIASIKVVYDTDRHLEALVARNGAITGIL